MIGLSYQQDNAVNILALIFVKARQKQKLERKKLMWLVKFLSPSPNSQINILISVLEDNPFLNNPIYPISQEQYWEPKQCQKPMP